MASYFNLSLDTTAPVISSFSINSGATYATARAVSMALAVSDGVTTGYTMKLWGDIGDTHVDEVDATWEAFATSKAFNLTSGDGLKTVYVKVRDDVYNVSSESSATITLDTTVPVVTITGPDVAKISTQEGKNESAFSFVSDTAFVEYKVKLVPATSSLNTAGGAIPTAGGSTNMSGTAGNYPANTAINCTINGADLSSAASATDGTYIIKVFVKDSAGNWSI